MGDEIKEETEELETSEEDEALGEVEVEESETEETAEAVDGVKEETEAETETEEPQTIPKARFDEVNEKKKEYQQKLDQLKDRDPEAYYEYFPDERPEPSPETKAPMTPIEGSLIVEGGPHDGMTINDVFGTDPAAAMTMILEHRDAQRETASQQADADRKIQEEVDRELGDFSTKLSKDFFKKDKDLTKEESGKINEVISETLAWANKTGRGGRFIEDAYYLMNRENDLAKARGETVKGIAASLRAGTTSISSSKTIPTDTGWERFASYTATEARDELDKLPDEKQAAFLKEAPKSVREKFPALNWK